MRRQVAPLQAADGENLIGLVGLALGDFDEQVVAEESLRRLVQPARFVLPPEPQLADDGQVAGVERADPRDATPILAVLRVDDALLPLSELVLEPHQPAALVEDLGESIEQRQQVANVLQGVVDLSVGQRTAAPIGTLLSLHRLLAEELADDRAVGGGELVRAKPGGVLHVEAALRDGADGAEHEAQFLAAGVEDGGLLARGDGPPEGEHVDFLRVDDCHFVGSDDLDQAQLRMKRVLGDEFGVETDDRRGFKPLGEFVEIALADNGGRRHLASSSVRRKGADDERNGGKPPF